MPTNAAGKLTVDPAHIYEAFGFSNDERVALADPADADHASFPAAWALAVSFAIIAVPIAAVALGAGGKGELRGCRDRDQRRGAEECRFAWILIDAQPPQLGA